MHAVLHVPQSCRVWRDDRPLICMLLCMCHICGVGHGGGLTMHADLHVPHLWSGALQCMLLCLICAVHRHVVGHACCWQSMQCHAPDYSASQAAAGDHCPCCTYCNNEGIIRATTAADGVFYRSTLSTDLR
jgi:hypothetical protein